MKHLTTNRKSKGTLLLAVALILACTVFTAACSKEPDPPELKTVKIRDAYTLKDGKIKVTPLIAVYYDKQEDREFEKQLTDYRFYVDDQEMEIDDDGTLEIEKGEYTFRVNWINDGHSDQYEKNVRVKGPKTWGKYPELVGKTLAEIKNQYGGILMNDTYDGEGAKLYRIKGFKIWASFGSYEDPRDTDKCFAVEGPISEFFNNIEEKMTGKELATLLGIPIDTSAGDSEHEVYFADKLPDGNVMFIYHNQGIITPKDFVMIKEAW